MLFFVCGNILFFVIFLVVLYVTTVPKIYDILLLLRMTSRLSTSKESLELRIPFGVLELELP